jgi:hypothetical protein
MNHNLEEKINKELFEICQSAFFDLGIDNQFWFPSTLDSQTMNHELRVCLYSILVSRFLFSENQLWKKYFTEAALKHDHGKADVERVGVYKTKNGTIIGGRGQFEKESSFVNKKENFTEDDQRKMKDHIDLAIMFEEEPIKTIIAYHHFWQKKSVLPVQVYSCKQTIETDYLSKLLGIIDFYDAAHRVNTRNSEIPKKLTQSEIKKILLEEYGNLKIKYSGKEFPKIDMEGENFIESFYERSIFGDNLIEQFLEPIYNFSKRFFM